MNSPVATSIDAVLYTPRQIYVASFIGSPMAAAWFMALNHRALVEPHKQQHMLILGGAATIVAAIVAFLLPEQTPNIAWPLAYSIAVYYFANSRFGSVVERHLAEGGQQGSWWRLIGVSLLFCLAILTILFAAIVLFFEIFP